MILRKFLRGFKYVTTGSLVGFSLYMLHKNGWDVRSIGVIRFGRAAITASRCIVDYKVSLRNVDPSTEEYKVVMSKVHKRSAERLRDMCCINGGCFIKVGQHLGALEYLLPVEYVETMKVLHSDAPQTPVEKLYQVIKEDLGKDVNELFNDFSPHPQGTASLAQVHRATLSNGEVVAVKIQHPLVKSHSFVDIATMEFLVRAVAWIFPEFKLLWLAEETKANLPIELNFVQEGKNCERVAKMLSNFHFLKIPKVFWQYTSERVLTMEFCEGGQVNDKMYMKKNKIDVNEIPEKLGILYSEMIFVNGFIHCDPHPGNVLVKKGSKGDAQLVLLDHGLYITLTDEFRLNYCKLWQSLLDANLNDIKKYAQRMGTGELYHLYACMVTARSWQSLTKGVQKANKTKKEADEVRENVVKYLPEITEVLSRVPSPMIFLFKTNDLLRGIESSLSTSPSAQSFIPMSRCCVRALYKHRRSINPSYFGYLKFTVLEQWTLFKLQLYQIFLWTKSLYSKKTQVAY